MASVSNSTRKIGLLDWNSYQFLKPFLSSALQAEQTIGNQFFGNIFALRHIRFVCHQSSLQNEKNWSIRNRCYLQLYLHIPSWVLCTQRSAAAVGPWYLRWRLSTLLECHPPTKIQKYPQLLAVFLDNKSCWLLTSLGRATQANAYSWA